MATGRVQLRSWKPGLDHGSRWGLHFDQEKSVLGGWALYFDQEKSVLGDTCCFPASAKQWVTSAGVLHLCDLVSTVSDLQKHF